MASLKEALATAGCKGAMFNKIRAAIQKVCTAKELVIDHAGGDACRGVPQCGGAVTR